jgi:hypothetical protein
MENQNVPLLSSEEFQKLIGKKKSYWLCLTPIKCKTHLFGVLEKKSFYGEVNIYIISHSKKSFAKSVKFLKEDFCAKETPIEKFPVGEWINCWIGDPIEIELCLIGKYNPSKGFEYFVFKTKEGDLVLSADCLGRTSFLEPVSNSNH